MNTIAVLGATSHIAKDYIRLALAAGYDMRLFSRRPGEVADWLSDMPAFVGQAASLDYCNFTKGRYDAILNFVGSGDPARTAKMGAEVFDVTETFDRMASEALRRSPQTRYLFLSSGAAYGLTFLEPVTAATPARLSLNAFSSQEYYSVAKLYAECRHRAQVDHAIVDLRVFGYFSHTANSGARFFISDILRAIQSGTELETGEVTMWRDYMTPKDFFALVEAVLASPPANCALDTYSRAPVEKFALLDAFDEEFGLRYRVVTSPVVVTATGAKPMYYSLNRKAAEFGYSPRVTALEGVISESRDWLAANAGTP